MHLQYIYYSKESEPHTSHMKSDWNPPVQPSMALETFYTRWAKSTQTIVTCMTKPLYSKGQTGEPHPLMVSWKNKINEGLALLNERNINYQPLTQPMVENTTRKVKQKAMLMIWQPNGHLLRLILHVSLLIFYTLTKIYKPTPVSKPMISGCDGPTQRISTFVDRFIQPIE